MPLLRRRRRVGFYSRSKGGFRSVVFFFVAAVALLFCVIEFSLRPTIISFAEAQARWTATEAIDNAIMEEIPDDLTYEDLVHVEKDKSDRIVFMHANTAEVNRLSSSIALNIQETLEQLENDKFAIPLGQVLGSKLLASYGPGIKLLLLPVGTVKVTPEDRFEEAGINQTRHRIYLDVDSPIKVVIPLISSVVEVKLQVPIVDAIIVGDVPDTYLNLELGQGQNIPFNVQPGTLR